jgi:hypothetical protein
LLLSRRTGRLPGLRNRSPAKPVTLMAGEDLQRHGIPVRSARNRALQHLFTAAPPPIIADALGYHPGTAFTHHEQAAGALP